MTGTYRPPPVTPFQKSAEPPGAVRFWPAIAAAILAVVVNVLVLADVDLPAARPVLGFWFIIALPAYLVYTSSAWRRCNLEERLGYSIGSVLLVLMVTGLIINEFLPLAGVPHPLGTVPVLILSDVINLSLFAVRSRYPDRIRWRGTLARLSREEVRLLAASVLALVLAVLGANHLNNGASGHVTWVALAVVALIGIGSVRWLEHTRESVMLAVIYLVALALLLSTSLRGWYVTGHDIQQEYLVFQLTEFHGHWSMSYFHDPYNACLSITILPTELARIINVDSPYIFKLFFQMIFALCPVMAYGIARRFFNRGISTLSVAYFLSFPTFFTDEPFLNRQEISLLFVAVGLLAVTNPSWGFRRRQVAFGVAGLGTEISHYSTMYVLVGTVMIGLVLSFVSRIFIKSGRVTRFDPLRLDIRRAPGRWLPKASTVLSMSLVAAFLGIIFVWGTLATGTTSQVLYDGRQAITSGSFNLATLPGGSIPTQAVLHDLRTEGLQARAAAGPGTYLPWAAVSKAPTPAVDQQLTAFTTMGNGLNSVGVPVATLNTLARSLVAVAEEGFLAVGLIGTFIGGARRGRLVSGQFFWLAAGSTGMILVITVLPSISADYGVLRAFQQGLLFFAPIIVLGSMTAFSFIGKARSRLAACLITLGIFLATSTLIPQLLGGNAAELNLNNSGFYYDLYYMTPQQSSAVGWLDGQPNVLDYPIQASWDSRKFFLTGPSIVTDTGISDDYPALVYQHSWVILGTSTVKSGTAYSFEPTSGATVEYRYPTGLLNDFKNLVYTDGGSAIYK